MKNKELFNRTISVLVKAYFDKTLAHGDCACCAVGNLVCAGYGEVMPTNPFGKLELTKYRGWADSVFGYIHTKKAQENISVTGYNRSELEKIEESFEIGNNIHWQAYKNHTEKEIEECQYNGLMRVVDTLMVIHEANETEVKEAKELFVKA